jgi:hypothetical protein
MAADDRPVPAEPTVGGPRSVQAIDISPAGVGTDVPSPRRYLVGAVTHGYQVDEEFPDWVAATAGALGPAGYHVAIPFDWAARSKVAPKEWRSRPAGSWPAGSPSSSGNDSRASGPEMASTSTSSGYLISGRPLYEAIRGTTNPRYADTRGTCTTGQTGDPGGRRSAPHRVRRAESSHRRTQVVSEGG